MNLVIQQYSHAIRRKSTPRRINSPIADSKSHLSRETVSPSTSPRRALPLHPVSRLSCFSMAVPSSSALRRDHTIHRSISLIEPFKPTIHSSSSRQLPSRRARFPTFFGGASYLLTKQCTARSTPRIRLDSPEHRRFRRRSGSYHRAWSISRIDVACPPLDFCQS